MELLAERQTRGYEVASLSQGIEKRILFLDPADRKFLQLTLRGTLSRREVGLLLGLTCGTVTRRLHGLLNRLNDPLVVALVERGEFLPELHREVGLAYFLRGMSITQIEVAFQLSRYAVRRRLEYVRGWHKAVGSRQ
jgi:DNA-directed RNA polymerase specialized sigma24 family protein